MKSFIFSLALLLTASFTSAQMLKWHWDLYNIEFSVPSDFKVSKNDNSGFAAGNSHINLTIYPQANPGSDINTMNVALEKWATSAKLTYTNKAQEMFGKLNGFTACFLDGTASNGLPTTVMFLSNPDDPATGYYVWFQYQKEYEKQAGEMTLSLAPHKKGSSGSNSSTNSTTNNSNMLKWHWDLYNIEFAVPSDFKVIKNDNSGFAAGNTHVNLTIYPQANPGNNIDAMNVALEKWATSAKLSYSTKAQEMSVKLNGFTACFLDGTAPNGLPTTVMFLSNPNDPATGYYVWLQYHQEYSFQVVEIMGAMAPHKKGSSGSSSGNSGSSGNVSGSGNSSSGNSGMTTWTWDIYKVKYEAPSDFKVISSSKDGFSAGNQRINLSIYPDHSKTHDRLDMAMSLEKWAGDNKLSYDGFAQELEDLNRYWGYYIDGTAPNGLPTTVLLLTDPDYPEIGLYVWLQYKSEYLEEAIKIARSFMPN